MKASLWTLIAVSGLAAGARGQLKTFEFIVSNDISPDQPSATVEVWASWDANQYAFAGGAFDVVGMTDPGAFSDRDRKIKGPQTKDGAVAPDGDSVLGVVVFQIHGIGGILADTSNPILAWRATWSTSDFSPRSIDLATVTSEYSLYTDPFGSSRSFLDDFAEGSGVIHVVPAPAGLIVVGSLGLVLHWRRTDGAAVTFEG